MQKVSIEAIDSYMGPASVKRPLTEALETEMVALNYYELDPSESFAFGYHAHADQEEVFYIQRGVATFETSAATDASDSEPPATGEEIEVEAGEAIRFAPGEYQQGHNRSDERVVALALGAPKDVSETEILRECVGCGERTPQTIEMTDERDALRTVCGSCGATTGRFD